jgi:hypothetical protein
MTTASWQEGEEQGYDALFCKDLTSLGQSKRMNKKGSLVHVVPACAGSGKGPTGEETVSRT